MGVTVRKKSDKPDEGYWVFVSQHYQRKSIYVGDERKALALAEKIRAQLTLGKFS